MKIESGVLVLFFVLICTAFVCAECTDSDGGLNYFEKGSLDMHCVASCGAWIDSCQDDKTLFEYSCDNENGVLYVCEEGCENGACLSVDGYTKENLKIDESKLIDYNEAIVVSDFDVKTFCNESLPEDFVFPSKAPFSDEVLNVYLGNESVGYVILAQKEITSYGCGENEKPTYKVFIKSENVVNEILNAEDVIGEYNKQRSDGGLRVEGVGAWRSLKLFFINLFSKFL